MNQSTELHKTANAKTSFICESLLGHYGMAGAGIGDNGAGLSSQLRTGKGYSAASKRAGSDTAHQLNNKQSINIIISAKLQLQNERGDKHGFHNSNNLRLR
jgi:hypothetical protein